MSTRQKKSAVYLIFSLAIAFGSSILFAEHGSHGKMDPEIHMEKMSKKLNLSNEQKDQIKQMLLEKNQKLEELWKEMHEIKMAYQEKIKAILTEEQKKDFDKLHGKHHERCEKACCLSKK